MPSEFVLQRLPVLADAIERRNARDVVAEKLASVIASGLLQVGDSLPSERDLAAALQVSRETVRGGMQILATLGIIEVSHGLRTRVISSNVGKLATGLREPVSMNRYDLEAVHSARLLVERSVVSDAALRISEGTLGFLAEALNVQRKCIDDPVQFLISDREFHLAIYSSAGNPVLADFVSDLYTYMLEHRRNAMAKPGAIQKSYEDHVAIMAGLRAHDPVAVVAAFDIHLDRIYATTQSILKSGQTGSQHPSLGGGGDT